MAQTTIPHAWDLVRLDSAGTVVTGRTPPTRDRSNYGHDYLFAGPADLGDAKYVKATSKMLSGTGFARSRRVPAGSTLFVCIGSSIGKTGIAAMDLTTNQQINAIIPRNCIDGEYLYYAASTLSSLVREQAGEQAVPIVNKSQFGAFEIPLPPKPEQRAIAAVLADADELVAVLERMIAKKQAIKQGMMQRLFQSADVDVAREHATHPRQLVEFLRQPATYGIVKAGEFQRSGVAMIRGGDIRNGRVSSELPRVTRKKSDEYARTVLQEGDVVVALVGYPGATAVVPHWLVGANISRAVGLLRPARDLLPAFLAHYLNSPLGRREFLRPSAGSAQIVVNLADLNRMTVGIPSIDMQRGIAATLSDADAEIYALQAQLCKAKAIRMGMMQQLLTGRTRLPMKATS